MFIRSGQAGMPLTGDFWPPDVRKAASRRWDSASRGLSWLCTVGCGSHGAKLDQMEHRPSSETAGSLDSVKRGGQPSTGDGVKQHPGRGYAYQVRSPGRRGVELYGAGA